MDKQFLNELNQEYNKLELKEAEIFRALFHRIFDLESHWYSGHYYKDDNGKWYLTSYPIPVIDVKGFCDIEVSFDKISVSTKLKRDKALTYSFEKFENYEFEVYGVNNYLLDFFIVDSLCVFLKIMLMHLMKRKLDSHLFFLLMLMEKKFLSL